MHTERRLLQSDPWQQWQAFAAQFAKGADAARGPAAAASFAPFTDVAERFAVAARTYFAAANADASAPAPAAAARIFTDSLREMFADFQPWNLGVGASTGPGSVPPGFTPNSPALGATREHQQRWERMADAWRRIEEAQRRLQRLGADALREAAATFASRLAASRPPVENPEALHKLYGSWIDCAEDAYGRAAHSEPFCGALAECVNASSEWRRELQASIEHSAKLLDLPTRSEINTLTQRVKSLEEDVRALRRVRKTRPARRKAKP
jgi:Poly(R)-hydroxyalkanoic acid synthase subunit (PHA_synth_III_E)